MIRRPIVRLLLSGALVADVACAADRGRTIDLVHRDHDPGEWFHQGSDYALSRYSPLAQLTTANVGQLHTAWTYSTGRLQGHEGTPLVVDNTMFIVTPLPDEAVALDLTKQGAVKWKHVPAVNPWAEGIACCDVVNRGWAYADGKLIY